MGLLSNIREDPFVLMLLPAVLIAMVLHEIAHGFAAYKLGDPTAREDGRLSLNPLRHLDPMGFLLLLFAGFGWAKPVGVDMRYFKHPKRDMALTALAGPMTNFILAIIGMFFFQFVLGVSKLQITYEGEWIYSSVYSHILISFLMYFTMINIGLGVFNLIPLPPLDGSRVLTAFLPDRAYFTVMRYERYGMLILMAVMVFGTVSFIGPVRDGLFNAFWKITFVPAQWLAGLFNG